MRVKNGALTLKDAYKLYLEKHPKGSKYYVDKSKYLKICYSYNKLISKLMINEGEQIRLPFRLSTIGVKKYKTDYSNPVFDYKEYNLTGKKTFIINEHSDDFTGYFHWHKCKCLVKGRTFYNFKATRDNGRAVAKVMKTKNGHKIYSTND